MIAVSALKILNGFYGRRDGCPWKFDKNGLKIWQKQSLQHGNRIHFIWLLKTWSSGPDQSSPAQAGETLQEFEVN